MEDFESMIGAIEHYKNKSCELIKCNCDKCEASYEYGGKKWCGRRRIQTKELTKELIDEIRKNTNKVIRGYNED